MDKLIKSALNAVFALTAAGVVAVSTNSIAAQTSADKTDTEKCYGIAKAGMNDCAAGSQSCAGSSTKDSQPDAFVFVPKGLCAKIVGGTVK